MIIRTSVMLLLSVYAFYIAMRYNMHMFQLNGYKNGEHWNRMKKNMRQQLKAAPKFLRLNKVRSLGS